MVSGEWPCWKAITTESRDTPSGPTRSAPWESSSTYFFDEIMRSSEPRFADAQADPKVILPPRDNACIREVVRRHVPTRLPSLPNGDAEACRADSDLVETWHFTSRKEMGRRPAPIITTRQISRDEPDRHDLATFPVSG